MRSNVFFFFRNIVLIAGFFVFRLTNFQHNFAEAEKDNQFLYPLYFLDILIIFKMDDSVVLSSAPANAPSPPVKRSNACRCLFGRPDPRVVDEWLKEQLDQIRYEQQLKWGFGFDPENPCATSSNDYVFTAVPADSVSFVASNVRWNPT